MPHNFRKLISLFISFCLILEQSVFAQSIDLSHYFANSGKPILLSDKFRPLHLRYLGYDNLNNDFKILLDKGDTKKEDLDNKNYLEENTQTLLKYFFIGLALPNEKFWVNLRPDSPDNILDPDLEKTDIGRIFLEADLQLKKDTASFTSPQTPQGKAYWDKLYQKAGELFGTENITIPTITRPWIVPNEIIIREAPDNAYIYKATLKVMLEEDYLKSSPPSAVSFQQSKPNYQPLTSNYNFSDPRLKELNEYSTRLIKETIIPKLTYEVNTSKRYAPLRQVYYSLILAQWFKQKCKGEARSQKPENRHQKNPYIKLIDSRDLTNLTSIQPYDKQNYFQQYQKSFADGEYNLTEPVYTPMGQSIRKYMSGGISNFMSSSVVRVSSAVENKEEDLKKFNFEGKGFQDKAYPEILKQVIDLLQEEVEKIEKAAQESGFFEKYNDFKEGKIEPKDFLRDLGVFRKKIKISTYDLTVDFWGSQIRITYDLEDKLNKAEFFLSLGVMNGMTSQKKEYFEKRMDSYIKLLSDIKEPLKITNKYVKTMDESKAQPQLTCGLLLAYKESLRKNDSKASSSINRNKTGGIDFHALPIKNDYLIDPTAAVGSDRPLLPLQINAATASSAINEKKELFDNLNLREGIGIEQYKKLSDEEKWYLQNSFDEKFGAKLDMKQLGFIREGTLDDDVSMKNLVKIAQELVNVKASNVISLGRSPYWFVEAAGLIDTSKEKRYGYIAFSENWYGKNREGKLIQNPDAPGSDTLITYGNYLREAGIDVKEIVQSEIKTIFVEYVKEGKGLKSFLSVLLSLAREEPNITEAQLKNNIVIYALYDSDSQDIKSAEFFNFKIFPLKVDNQLMASLDMNSFQDNFGVHYPPRKWAQPPQAKPKSREEVLIKFKIIDYLYKNGFLEKAVSFSAGGEEKSSASPVANDVSSAVTKNAESSFSESDTNKGGIAFHALPIQTETVASSVLGSFSAFNAFKGDLDAEWVQIQAVFNAGIRPSIQRLSEYTVAVSAGPLAEEKTVAVRGLLADILRSEEESQKLTPTDPALKGLLSALEA